LRTPLSIINWHLEILQNSETGRLNKQQAAALEKATAGAENMTELVGALLDASRLELGTLKVQHAKTNLLDIVVGSVEKEKLKAKNKKISIKVNAKLKHYYACSDPKFMSMTIDNILNNAIKYSPEKGRVTVQLEKTKAGSEHVGMPIEFDGILISIEDSGMGIPEKDQSRIFTKMFRANNAQTSPIQGTGLGLYLAHMIVKSLNGKVWFKSILGQGTTFYIFLPRSCEELTKKEP
jgi:signal transduction histidine kinase